MENGASVTNPVVVELKIEYDRRKLQLNMVEKNVMVALEKIGHATRTIAQVYNLVDQFSYLDSFL